MSSQGATAEAGGNQWVRAMPAVFVLIWSTGFVVARFGMPYAPPLTFLAIRFALSILLFLPWIGWARVAWPGSRVQWGHLAVTGVLMHAGYLGPLWAAIKAGMGAGLSALIVGLQPLLTAVWLSAFGGPGHVVTRRQWAGLLLGFGGLVLVLYHRFGQGGEVTWFTLGLCVVSLVSITAGTLYQKRFVKPCDVRTANVVQLLAALAVAAPIAMFETAPLEVNASFLGALLWSSAVLTLGGSSLLYLLIQRGAAASVTSLMYLVPPCTAFIAWLLFGESITPSTVAGTLLTAFGVSLVVRVRRT